MIWDAIALITTPLQWVNSTRSFSALQHAETFNLQNLLQSTKRFSQSASWTFAAISFYAWANDAELYRCAVSLIAHLHYNDVITNAMASQITSLTIVYSTVYSGTDQRKHQSSATLAFVRGIYRWPVNSPHKEPVTRKMFPFDDVTMPWNFGVIFQCIVEYYPQLSR